MVAFKFLLFLLTDNTEAFYIHPQQEVPLVFFYNMCLHYLIVAQIRNTNTQSAFPYLVLLHSYISISIFMSISPFFYSSLLIFT